MRCVIALVLVVTACVAPAWATAPTAPIEVFSDDDYRPVSYLENGAPKGFLIDVIHYAEKTTGTPLKLTLFPWRRAYVGATQGRAGIIGLSRTPERELIFDFSDPIYEDDINIIVRTDRVFPHKALADLRGRIIGAQLGASYGAEIDAAEKNHQITLERDTSHTNRLLKLLYGRIDCALIGRGQVGFEEVLCAPIAIALWPCQHRWCATASTWVLPKP